MMYIHVILLFAELYGERKMQQYLLAEPERYAKLQQILAELKESPLTLCLGCSCDIYHASCSE